MMPWKLLAFIAIMVFVLVFVGFNLDNRCDISLIFVSFKSVPVVITILGTYVLGLLSAFFLSMGHLGRAKKKAAKGIASGAGQRSEYSVPSADIDEPGRSVAPAKKKKKS
ncbi:MAG: hypothetical protein CVV47_00840 [Spirochaetae bacterium HGW-Spirochaetae-3]|jgi:uncharacterized integral membrane protein|nr:MAG: hypothetical protein CVV47_00840 [Spirochaetae bacterium HGW-Spirochaetae-3]